MSRFMERVLGISLLVVVATAAVCVGYAVWHTAHEPPQPFNAQQTFVRDCEAADSIPDVHTAAWTCQDTDR